VQSVYKYIMLSNLKRYIHKQLHKCVTKCDVKSTCACILRRQINQNSDLAVSNAFRKPVSAPLCLSEICLFILEIGV